MAATLAQAKRGSDAGSRASSAKAESSAQGASGVPAYLRVVQKKCDACSQGQIPEEEQREQDQALQSDGGKVGAASNSNGIHGTAARGVSQANSPLPGAARIQASFGRHDISGVRAQVGGSAAEASHQMGAHAYTLGRRIGFKSEPDVKLAAHEAAHVVQQRRGVSLKDGVGRPGDKYERQADAVAERVAANQSAEDLLDDNADTDKESARAVQAKCACGGTCAKCAGGLQEEEAGAVQMDLEVNATRQFEAMLESSEEGASSHESDGGGEGGGDGAAGGEASEGGGAEADGGGEGDAGGTDAAASEAASSSGGSGGAGGDSSSASPPPGAPDASSDGGASSSAPEATSSDASGMDGGMSSMDGGMSTMDGGMSSMDAGSSSSVGGGAGPTSSGPVAPAATPGDTGGAAPAPSTGGAGGGGTATSSASGACSGGGEAHCYHEPAEEPAEEPEETPPNPEATQVQEEPSAGDEADAPEVDDCPAAGEGGAPGAGGTGDASGASPPAAPGADGSAAPAGPEAAAPAAAPTGAGGGGGGAGAAEPAPMSIGSPLDGVIGAAEAQRGTAVAAYGASSAALGAAAAGTSSLRAGVRFAARPNESVADATRRRTASARAESFFGGVAGRLDDAIDMASSTIPDQLGAAAESAKAQIAASIETQKLSISARIEQARGEARTDAAMARSAVIQQAESFVADADAQTASAIETLTAAHGDAMAQVDDLETTSLDSVNQVYADGRTDLEGLGTTIGDECTAKGDEFAATYRGFRHCTENGFWDGDLSERRSEAQENAAHSVAQGYHDRINQSARRRAREITRDGRKKDRCSILASATTSRDTLDEQLGNLTSAIEAAHEAAITQASSTRESLLGSIDSSLNATLSQLDQQEHDQRQAADDTGYMQQLMQEQLAHSAAAGIQQGVSNAVSAVQSALGTIQAQCASSEAPEPAMLDQALLQAEQKIGSALSGLMSGTDSGASAAESQLAGAAQAGLSALDGVTQSNDEQTQAISGGFTSGMSSIAGTDNFATQRTGFTQQMTQSTSAGSAALAQVVDGMRNGCDATLAAARATLTQGHTDLEANLRQSKQGMECEIPRQADEAASHEAPAWKRLVAVLLVILVIVIVIAVIVASGGAAMAALVAAAGPIGAGILVGAAVGAVTSGLLAVSSNLWNNRSWTQGVGHAMLVGAITGAIGGGLGAGVGLAFKGASVAVQLGSQLVTATGMDVATQFVTGGFSFEHFSWSSLGMTTVITVLTFGLGHAVASRAPSPTGAGAGEPLAPGAVPEGSTGPRLTEPTAIPEPSARAAAPESLAPPETTAPTTPETPTPTASPETAPPAAPEAAPVAETPAAPAEAAPPAAPEAAAPAAAEAPVTEAPATEPAQPATPEETAVLDRTAGKDSAELTPEEVLTEREVASRGEPEPINEPPFTTERELANGHEMKETPDGEFCERCSRRCATFNSDGDLVETREGGAPEPEDGWNGPSDPDPEFATGAAERAPDVAHDVGVQLGREQAVADGLDPSPEWENPLANRGNRGNGFDDVLVDSATGNDVIGEYKGGEADLAPGQMERDWVQGVINRMRATGDVYWANRLQAQLDAGTLTGVAYSTPIDPVTGAALPTRVIGRWTY